MRYRIGILHELLRRVRSGYERGDNMRAIDAENIRIKPEFMHNVCGIAMIRVEDVIRILNDQPTIQPEPHWIPVTERLPKEDGSYLVSGKWGSGKESVGDCEFSVEDGYFQTAWNFDVLAWMPLPEPYKVVTE